MSYDVSSMQKAYAEYQTHLAQLESIFGASKELAPVSNTVEQLPTEKQLSAEERILLSMYRGFAAAEPEAAVVLSANMLKFSRWVQSETSKAKQAASKVVA